MGRLLESFVTQVPGYWRTGEEDRFPWSSAGGGIWYALLLVENGKVERYGFTSAAGQKAELAAALAAIPRGVECLLIGVWTGQHKTGLFVLDPTIAAQKLRSL